MNSKINNLNKSSLIRFEYPSSRRYNGQLNKKERIEFCSWQLRHKDRIWTDISKRLIEMKAKVKTTITQATGESIVMHTESKRPEGLRGQTVKDKMAIWDNLRPSKTNIISSENCANSQKNISHSADYYNLISKNLDQVGYWWRFKMSNSDEKYLFPYSSLSKAIIEDGFPRMTENIQYALDHYEGSCTSMTDAERLRFCEAQIEKIPYEKCTNDFYSTARAFWVAEKAVALHNIFINDLVVEMLDNNKNASLDIKAFLRILDPIKYEDFFKINSEFETNESRVAEELFKKVLRILCVGNIPSLAIVVKVVLDGILDGHKSTETLMFAVGIWFASMMLCIALTIKSQLASKSRMGEALKSMHGALLASAARPSSVGV